MPGEEPDAYRVAVVSRAPQFTTAIKDAPKAAEELKNTVGVVDHGLFCGMTTAVIIAGSDGISVKE
jgi:ribose 5-phosphate isomerase A